MKYVRTKDGRIVKCFPPVYPTCDNRVGYPSSKGLIFEEEILKQADNLEDLCDRCVCFFKYEDYPYICPIKDIEHLRELEQFGGKIKTNLIYENVYLAIWTEWGLKYVAKMNDKGDLELL